MATTQTPPVYGITSVTLKSDSSTRYYRRKMNLEPDFNRLDKDIENTIDGYSKIRAFTAHTDFNFTSSSIQAVLEVACITMKMLGITITDNLIKRRSKSHIVINIPFFAYIHIEEIITG